MTINGAACGIKAVDANHVEFVVPVALASAVAGTSYPVVLNNNGVVMKNSFVIVPVRPDVFNQAMFIGPGGRAKLFNVTNSIYTTEPFVVRTIKRRGNRLTASVLRLYLTGVANAGSVITIRIKDKIILGGNIVAGPDIVDPGIYTVDFALPPELEGAGDQPLVVTITINGVSFSSRLDDTSTKVLIL